MKINQAGLELLKSFEACRLTAYRDVVGVLTVGYGHTGPDVRENETINQAQADQLLENDLAKFERGVELLVKVQLEPNQFSALVCFAYNVGLGNLKASLLLKCLNSHNYKDAAGQFLLWDRARGVVIPGLERRRKAEKALFETPST